MRAELVAFYPEPAARIARTLVNEISHSERKGDQSPRPAAHPASKLLLCSAKMGGACERASRPSFGQLRGIGSPHGHTLNKDFRVPTIRRNLGERDARALALSHTLSDSRNWRRRFVSHIVGARELADARLHTIRMYIGLKGSYVLEWLMRTASTERLAPVARINPEPVIRPCISFENRPTL